MNHYTSQPVFAHKAAVESSQTSVAAGSSGVKSGSVSRTGSPAPSMLLLHVYQIMVS